MFCGLCITTASLYFCWKSHKVISIHYILQKWNIHYIPLQLQFKWSLFGFMSSTTSYNLWTWCICYSSHLHNRKSPIKLCHAFIMFSISALCVFWRISLIFQIAGRGIYCLGKWGMTRSTMFPMLQCFHKITVYSSHSLGFNFFFPGLPIMLINAGSWGRGFMYKQRSEKA